MESPQPLNPLVHTASRTLSKVFVFIFFGIVGFHAFILVLLGAGFTASSYGTIAYTGEASATVTGIQSSPSDDGGNYCNFGYAFEVDGTKYSGTTAVSTPDACLQVEGNTVQVKYDPARPTRNAAENTTSIFVGIVMLAIGLGLVVAMIVGAILLKRAARRSDRNNDGLFNDDMPATSAQLTLIENGMRDLGQFWSPRKMTQHEAREIIADINKKTSGSK